MAIAGVMFDDRHPSFFAYATDQTLAAARNAQVDILGHAKQLAHSGTVGGGHQLHGVGRQTGISGRLGENFGNSSVRVDGLFTAAQNDGVASLDA